MAIAIAGKLPDKEWEKLPPEIKERILEIRRDPRLYHSLVDPGKTGFKAGLGWGFGQSVGSGTGKLLGFCLILLMWAVIAGLVVIAMYASVGH